MGCGPGVVYFDHLASHTPSKRGVIFVKCRDFQVLRMLVKYKDITTFNVSVFYFIT